MVINTFSAAWFMAAGLIACGSSSGVTCPDVPPPPRCPECAAPPRPGPSVVEIPKDTLPTDREQRVSLVAFSGDGAIALLRVEDDVVGDLFKTVDLTTGPVPKVVKTWLFQGLTETVALKQAMRSLKSPAPFPTSQTNAAGVSLVAADMGPALVVLAMKGERAVPVAKIPRLSDEDGVAAEAAVTDLAWDPTGTRVVIVHRQKLAAAPGFESSWVHVIPLPPEALPF